MACVAEPLGVSCALALFTLRLYFRRIDSLKAVISAIVAIAFVFLIPVGLIIGKIAEGEAPDHKDATLICLISLIFLGIFNIDKIDAFKMWEMEVRLKTTIAEATATINELRSTALALSTPIYNQLAFNGLPFNSLKFKEVYHNKVALDATLEKIGVTKDQIASADRNWREVISYTFASMISTDKQYNLLLNPDQTKQWVELACKYANIDAVSIPPEEISTFLERNHLATDLAKSRLADYEAFLRTGLVNPHFGVRVQWVRFGLIA